MKKWEISMLVGVAAAILCCALFPAPMRWWTVAFEPLCDGLATAESAGTEVIVRSRLWELLRLLFP